MAEMKMHSMTSSQLHEIGYDDEAKKLHVRFKNGEGPGDLYEYDGVPENVFDQLRDASDAKADGDEGSPSVGSLFNQLVKHGGFVFRKVG